MQIRNQADVETFCDNVANEYVDGEFVEAVIGGELVTLIADGYATVEDTLKSSLGVTKFAHVYAYLRSLCGRSTFNAVVLGVLDGIEIEE